MSYRERLYQLREYIDVNLDDDLTVDKLSDLACLSKYHFHRQFSAVFGITAFSYIKQARMKRASYQLAFKTDMKIIDIAFSCGYESSEAFSRAFTRVIGQSPSQFREQPDWTLWNDKYRKVNGKPTAPVDNPHPVRVVECSEIKVASITHIGSLNLIGNTINQLFAWCGENNLSFSQGRMFNIVYDDPNVTKPDDYYCEICISINSPVGQNSYGVTEKVIPAGRCAVIRHLGSDDSISGTISYLYSHCLEESGETLRDSPLFIERLSLFPDVPEAEVTKDIYLPLM